MRKGRVGALKACVSLRTMQKYIKDALETPVDIAVATPESLLRYRLEGANSFITVLLVMLNLLVFCSERIHLSDLSHLVIDEADTLFDSSFEEAATSIIKGIRVRDMAVQPTPPSQTPHDRCPYQAANPFPSPSPPGA